MTTALRRCPGCGKDLPLSAFRPDSWHSNGLHPYCTRCVKRKTRTLSRVKNNPAERLRMWERQGRACGVCGLATSAWELEIDHDWDHDRIRGLLCKKCNCMLGDSNDSPETLGRAAFYLGHHHGRHSLALPHKTLFEETP